MVGAVAALATATWCSGQNLSAGVAPPVVAPPMMAEPASAGSAESATAASIHPTSTQPPASEPKLDPWSSAEFAELDAFLDAADTEAFRIVSAAEWSIVVSRLLGVRPRHSVGAEERACRCSWAEPSPMASSTLDTTHRFCARDNDGHRAAGPTRMTVRQLLTMTSGLDDRLAVIAGAGRRYGATAGPSLCSSMC